MGNREKANINLRFIAPCGCYHSQGIHPEGEGLGMIIQRIHMDSPQQAGKLIFNFES